MRAGYGIYYGGNQNDDFSDPAESYVPRYALTSADFPALSYPLEAFLDPANQLYSPKAIDLYRKDLGYQSWSATLQQDLGAGFIAQVGYVGGAGHHLFDKPAVNLIDPATGKRPLTQFNQFNMKGNNGNNTFNALQAQVQRRWSNGFQFQTNYMFSHGLVDSSIGSGEGVSYQNMSCRACDRSDSSVDVRHYFVLDSIYDLPFGKGKRYLNDDGISSAVFGGWSIMGIISGRTGLPVNITMTRKASQMLDGNTSNQRPNYVAGESLYPDNQSIDNWLNKAAFSIPAKYTWGNLGRYVAEGPGAFEVDATVQRKFRVTEQLALLFRASAYNLANHPIYANPASKWGSSSFGYITDIINSGATGSGAPRRFEFVFRAEF